MNAIARKYLLPVLALAALIVSGCQDVVSVYPFYTGKDLVSEPALAGFWCEAGTTNGIEGTEFTPVSRGRYTLKGHSPEGTNSCCGETNVMEVCLFKLKTGLYMDWDTTPATSEGVSIPQHRVWKVTELGAALELESLDYDWLREFLKQHPKALRHILRKPADKNSDIIMTADTRELQQFLIKHSKVPGLFSTNGVIRLARLAGGTSAQPRPTP